MGVLGRAFTVIAVVLLVASGTGSFLYVTDYGLEATITEKGRDASGSFVVATTRLGAYDHKQYVQQTEWLAIQVGHFVVYKIRSGDITVYESPGGTQVYPPTI